MLILWLGFLVHRSPCGRHFGRERRAAAAGAGAAAAGAAAAADDDDDGAAGVRGGQADQAAESETETLRVDAHAVDLARLRRHPRPDPRSAAHGAPIRKPAGHRADGHDAGGRDQRFRRTLLDEPVLRGDPR
ncbi:MAG TPA: hypothetical protein EYH34_18870, partial [Planctomycetes bacterium]|nr:hypothetical protein [Planctomycetota bacterium]